MTTASIYAYIVHLTLCQKSSSEALNLNPLHTALLIQLRRQALQETSNLIHQHFERGDVANALEAANIHLVPSLGAFAMSVCPGDEDALEKVREKWCHCLVHPGLTEGVCCMSCFVGRMFHSACEFKYTVMVHIIGTYIYMCFHMHMFTCITTISLYNVHTHTHTHTQTNKTS